ncbi:MAG: hypothetical protein E6I85_02785 [Chloroflexi bacterium]|nr:MAG: hypothetical protein E6I85_02785 [Chloroflexota bacterium]
MDFLLPRLADTLVEATVSRWLKRTGEKVSKGEPLVEVETDKVNSELEAPVEGVLNEILVPEGETAPVGAVLARITEAGEAADTSREAKAPATAAAARGVGRAQSEPSTADRGDVPPSEGGLSTMRRRIAERMQEARATIPQGACRKGGWTAYFVKALAMAAGADSIGVAVEVPEGLLVPVVKGATTSSTQEISARVGDLAERARQNRLQPAEVSGGAFTVTNVGGGGALLAFPLVNPGQPGILAPGAVGSDGHCFVTFCYDRRAYDDYAADRLLARVEEELARL